MPPKEKPRPATNEVATLTDWIKTKVAAADAKRAAEGRVVLHRLNRVEYENTVRDLLGIEVNLKEQLPQDGSAFGFDNIGDALHTSSYLMEKYLEAADTALNIAIANRLKPPSLIKKRYSLKESQDVVKNTTESVYRKLEDDTVICFCSSAWHSVVLSPFYPPDRGVPASESRLLAFKAIANRSPIAWGRPAAGRLSGKSGVIGYFDAPADKPTVIEFVEYMEPKTTISILPLWFGQEQHVKQTGADEWKGTGSGSPMD